eukprot:symbB.v1.2.015662.t1/scaffold1177.1/size133674/5
MAGYLVGAPSGFRTPPVPHGMHVRMQMPQMPRVQPVHRVIHQEACSQVRWRSADSGAETSRDPGTMGLPNGSRSSTETQPGGDGHPPSQFNRAQAQVAPMRFTSEPNRHELQEYVAQRLATRKPTERLGEHVEQLSSLLALTPGSTSRKSDDGAYGELLELLSAISAAARRQSIEAQKQLQEERLAAAERLAAFEAHSTQMREELQALRVEVQDSEALLRESRAEQSAEAALKAQLAEERRKAQEQQRVQEQLEQRLSQREDELQEAVRRSEERHKAQEAQLAELRERLQEAYEAQHHHQVRELIHAAAQEANILPREEPTVAASRQIFSPSLLTADSAVSSANSTFVFDNEAAPNTTNALAACGESGNNAAAKACSAGMLECSPLSATASPKLDARGSLISSLAPSSEVVIEPSPTESSLSAVANLDRSPGIRAGRPPSAASVLPGRVASLERGRAAAPSPHGTGTGSSLYALSSSEGSQPQARGRQRWCGPGSRPPTPHLDHVEAPPRGLVAEKIIFFDQRCQTPPSARGPSRRPSPVPTPLGRHVLPSSASCTGRSRVFGPAVRESCDGPIQLVASPPTHKECRRRLSYPEALQAD